MATNLNRLNCGVRYGNTGSNACDIEPGLNIQDLAIPRGYTFPLAATATPEAFAAAIAAGLVADNPTQRFYWLGTFQEVTATGEDAQRQTAAFGNSRQTRQATLGDQLMLWGGKNLYKEQYKTFHGKQSQFDIIRFDDQNVAWGKKVTVANGDVLLGGYRPSDISFSNYMEPDGTNGPQWMVNIQYVNAYERNVDFAAVILNTDPFAASTGLISVDFTSTSTGPTNVTTTGLTSYGQNLRDTYSTELAQIGAWDERNATTNAAITVASVAVTPLGWAITLAATGVDPDNPGSAGKITHGLAAPSVLAALATPVYGLASDRDVITLG